MWTTKPFTNRKKAIEKMKAHTNGDAHVAASQVALVHQASLHAESVIHQLQYVAEEERKISTNFQKLVELVVSCGGADLTSLLDRITYCCCGVHGSSKNMG